MNKFLLFILGVYKGVGIRYSFLFLVDKINVFIIKRYMI